MFRLCQLQFHVYFASRLVWTEKICWQKICLIVSLIRVALLFAWCVRTLTLRIYLCKKMFLNNVRPGSTDSCVRVQMRTVGHLLRTTGPVYMWIMVDQPRMPNNNRNLVRIKDVKTIIFDDDQKWANLPGMWHWLYWQVAIQLTPLPTGLSAGGWRGGEVKWQGRPQWSCQSRVNEDGDDMTLTLLLLTLLLLTWTCYEHGEKTEYGLFRED